MRMRHAVRGLGMSISAAIITLFLSSCDGGSNENPVSIGVSNPDPKDALYGVTLENEAQNLDRIKAGNGIKVAKKK